MQRGPVGQAAREHGVASLYLRVEARERREQRLAQHSADANLAAGTGPRILHDLTIAGGRVTAYHTNGVTTARTARRDAEKMKFALALAATIATLGGAHRASAEWQTTQPTLLYTVSAVLTDKSIQLTHTRVPRGVVIRYTIVNRGSRSYALQIWTGVTRSIPPKGRARLTVNWDHRGRFVYRTLYRGRPAGPHGSVAVV